MSSVMRDPLIEMVTARWDCGPGCGTTGCGNDPESLRRYTEYLSTGKVPPKGQALPVEQPSPRRSFLYRLLTRLAEWCR